MLLDSAAPRPPATASQPPKTPPPVHPPRSRHHASAPRGARAAVHTTHARRARRDACSRRLFERRPNLHDASSRHRRTASCPLECTIEIRHVDQKEASELLFRVGEGTILDMTLTTDQPKRRRSGLRI